MKKLFRFLVFLLIIYSLAAVGCFAYTFIDGDSANDGEFDYYKPARLLYEMFGGVPEKTNFVIFGTDEGGTRTDTIMAGSYSKKTGTLSLVSIPRDTIVTVDDETYGKMCENYPEPDGYSMKLNSVYHYTKEDFGADVAVSEVEKIIGADIDYYCIVDFEGLRYIVDSVGGIDFDVPCDMYYNDPEQDLYIALDAGEQKIDGDMAEQLLRFRSGYANADLGRVEVQQDFMKAFVNQVASKKSVMKNAKKYIKVYNDYVETDMSVARAIKYASEAKNIKTTETLTAPGYTDYVDEISGYVIDDEDGVLDKIFKK